MRDLEGITTENEIATAVADEIDYRRANGGTSFLRYRLERGTSDELLDRIAVAVADEIERRAEDKALREAHPNMHCPVPTTGNPRHCEC